MKWTATIKTTNTKNARIRIGVRNRESSPDS